MAMALAVVAAAPDAAAYCRTTTSPVPADYDPSVSGCWTEGLPVYWANACVSFDVQKDASKQVPYATANAGMLSAFATWTSTMCPASPGPAGRVSIDVTDLGPVDCDLVQYNQSSGNQHAILFRDDAWPYDDTSNTLALTTVTYDTLTGEIYDADMEINTHDQTLSTTTVVPPGGYDFESIVTHEAGHFLGLAHSTDTGATMYAHYTPGTDSLRELTADDVSGLCSVYSPDGLRHVSTAASESGTLEEVACDPTPRHGFSASCAGSGGGSGGGCNVASGGARLGQGDGGAWKVAVLLAVGLISVQRRRTSLPKA